ELARAAAFRVRSLSSRLTSKLEGRGCSLGFQPGIRRLELGTRRLHRTIHWQDNAHGSPLADTGLYLHLSPMSLEDSRDNGQPQAGSFYFGRAQDRRKSTAALLGAHPVARVGEIHSHVS